MKYLLALILLCNACLASAEVYRWIDKDGKVHFGDQPPPEADAQRRKYTDNTINSESSNYEINRAAKAAPVVLYTAPDCKETCDKARALLGKRKIPFSERSLVAQTDIEAAGKELGTDKPIVPSMMVGRQANSGYSESGWNAALDGAGYPKPL